MKNEKLLTYGCIAMMAMLWGAATAQEVAPVMVRLI